MKNEHLCTHIHIQYYYIIGGPVNRVKTKQYQIYYTNREKERERIDRRKKMNKTNGKPVKIMSKVNIEKKNRVFTVHSLKWLNENKKMKKTFFASDLPFFSFGLHEL